MDPPPPRFDSPLRAVSGTTKQLQHTKHLQRPAQQRQQQQQQTTQRRQQQQQHTQRRGSSSRSRPPSASSSSSSRRPGACRAPSAAAPSAAAAAAAPQHQQQQHQQQTTGSPASFRSPPLASSMPSTWICLGLWFVARLSQANSATTTRLFGCGFLPLESRQEELCKELGLLKLQAGQRPSEGVRVGIRIHVVHQVEWWFQTICCFVVQPLLGMIEPTD